MTIEIKIKSLKFKVGDRVKCLKDFYNMTIGKVYKILDEAIAGNPIAFCVINDKGEKAVWYSIEGDFELVEPWQDEEGDVHEEHIPEPVFTGKYSAGIKAFDEHKIGILPLGNLDSKVEFKSFNSGDILKECAICKEQKWIRKLGFVCAECTDKPLKPEDLKVGMVFEQDNSYVKINKLLKESILIELLFKDGTFGSSYGPRNDFLSSRKLIDKVPPKIVEVEEEVPVYINDWQLKQAQEGAEFPFGCIVSIRKEHDSHIELCKIKRKIKKELNWDWESVEWL